MLIIRHTPTFVLAYNTLTKEGELIDVFVGKCSKIHIYVYVFKGETYYVSNMSITTDHKHSQGELCFKRNYANEKTNGRIISNTQKQNKESFISILNRLDKVQLTAR